MMARREVKKPLPDVVGYVPKSERIMPAELSNAEPTHRVRYEFASKYLQPGDRVLDLGCGSGYGTKILSERCGSTVGVDYSTEAIEHAGRHFSGGNIGYQVVDVEKQKLPFPDSSFNCVVCMATIEHVGNPEYVLSEARRVTEKDGLLVISTPRKPHGSPFHKHEYTLEEFTTLLSRFFEVVEVFNQAGTDISRTASRPEGERLDYIAVCRNTLK